MKHARVQLFDGPRQPFRLAEVPLPQTLAPGELLVQIRLATVCGSDLHTFEGRRSAPVPCILGHEAVGTILQGERPGLRPGQRVTWSIADSCGHCACCTEIDLPQKCEHLFKYGHAALDNGSGLNGCYATHIVLRPGTAVFAVPESLPDAVVAPANCALATIVNALGERPVPCRTALVQGGGLLGLYACAWLRQQGVERIFCSDLSAQRLELVPAFGGIPLLVTPGGWAEQVRAIRAVAPRGVDLIIEVAGAPSVVPEGLSVLRFGGHYIWAGMVHPQSQLALTGESVIRSCATIRGVHNYAPRHLEMALRFLEREQHHLPFDRLVSPPLPLADLNEAIERSARREWLRIAVQPV